MGCLPDGTGLRCIVEKGQVHPDGIVVDNAARHIYWTNMGNPLVNDGSIYRADFDGKNVVAIVPQGSTYTPKQLQIDLINRYLYWCDREGMRVMRCKLDGAEIETLVDTSEGDARPGRDPRKWCVGIAVDQDDGDIYWTQKGGDNANEGRIFRANLNILSRLDRAAEQGIELLYDNLPEPIDLDLDLMSRMIYWTDRGDPPLGNTVNRAPMDVEIASPRPAPEILLNHLMEGIGLSLDLWNHRMFVTDLGGSIYSAKLDGSQRKMLLAAQGNLAGIAYAENM